MRKKLLPFIAIIMLAFVGACSNEDVLPEIGSETNPELTGRTLSFTASMPDEDGPSTRVSVEEGADRTIALTWNATDKIDLLFVQGTNKINESITVESVDATGKNATFTVPIPEGISEGEPFDLYGVYGGGEVSTTNPELIKLPAIEGTTLNEENVGKNVMLRFMSTIDPAGTVGTVNFNHIGILFTTKIKVTAGSVNDITSVQLVGADDVNETWAYNASANHLNLETGEFTNEGTGTNAVSFQNVERDATNSIITVRNWFPAIGTAWPALKLSINNGVIDFETNNTKPSRTPAVGKAYYLYATWDGIILAFANRTDVEPADGTKEKPYSVAEAIADVYVDGVVVKDKWIRGFIVGSYNSGSIFGINNASEYNVNIAGDKDATTGADVVNVQLPAGDMRNLSLKVDPSLYKAEVLFRGDIEKYNGLPGLKQTSDFLLISTTPLFIADKSTISFTSSFDLTSTIAITTNDTQTWTVTSSDDTWLTVAAGNGTGSGAVTITAQENTEIVDRVAIVTLTPTGDTGLAPVVVTVTQAAFVPFIDVAPTSLTFEKEAGSRTIDVTANIAWTATSNADWLTLTPASGTNDGAVTVDAEANSGADARNATITITPEAISGLPAIEYSVTQAGADAVYAETLFFSEYVHGTSNNKYLEIYNGTGATIDLSNYVVKQYNNGKIEASAAYTLELTGTLENGKVFVIANNSATIYNKGTPDLSTSSSVLTFNGDDAITLEKKTGEKIDIFGVIGEYSKDKGWKVGDITTFKKTLVRKPNVKKGVASSTPGFPELGTQWTQYDQNTIYLGEHDTSY